MTWSCFIRQNIWNLETKIKKIARTLFDTQKHKLDAYVYTMIYAPLFFSTDKQESQWNKFSVGWNKRQGIGNFSNNDFQEW